MHARVIGIDPGTRVAGYGIVDVSDTGIRGVAAGVWRLNAEEGLPTRLAALAIEFRRALEVYKPTHLCIELAFVAENVRSALYLGHARGVVLSEACQYGLAIAEISATAAKKMITNSGRADKKTVSFMIGRLLNISTDELPLDATDALGIAYAEAVVLRRGIIAPVQNQVIEEWRSARKGKNKSFASILPK